jgi:hypothetical protein
MEQGWVSFQSNTSLQGYRYTNLRDVPQKHEHGNGESYAVKSFMNCTQPIYSETLKERDLLINEDEDGRK